MKSAVAIIVGVIVALLVIGGVGAVAIMSMEHDDSSQMGHALNKIKEKLTGKSVSEGSGSSNGGSVVEKVGHVVKEEIVESGQEPGKIYREVTYSDGNVRQYDNATGELIGSTFESDQDKLPSVE